MIFLLGIAACGDGPAVPDAAARRPDVLLILIDTLRADHLSVYGYERATSPALDALAAQGTVFTRIYAQAPYTPTSVASLLTSTYPSTHGVVYPPNAREKFRPVPQALATLPEALLAAGYQTAAVSSHPWIRPEFGYGRGFQRFEVVSPEAYSEDRALESRLVVRRAQDLLLQDREKPFFLYLHLMGPHWPYAPSPEYDRFQDSSELTPLVRQLDALPQRWMKGLEFITESLREKTFSRADLEILKARYDGLIRQTDDALAELFGTLRETGAFDETLIVVTADHGEEFLEHDRLFHRSLYNEVLRVPLILAGPGAPRRSRESRLGETVDIPFTILEMAGVTAPPTFKGESLLSPGDKRFVISEFAAESKVQDRRWSVIRQQNGRARLFDLEKDPGENEDRSGQFRQTVRQLLETSEEAFEPMVAEDEELLLDERTSRQLKALGYLGGEGDAAEPPADADPGRHLMAFGYEEAGEEAVRFLADPNPVSVCDGSGLGVATFYWQVAESNTPVEIRVRAPDGKRMSRSRLAAGSAKTRKWARNGTSFYLVESETGKTLASTVVRVSDAECGTGR